MSFSYSTATIIAFTVLFTTSICVQTSPVPAPVPVQNTHSKLLSLEKNVIDKSKENIFHVSSKNKADDVGRFLYAEAVKNNLIQVIQMLNRKSRAYRFSHPLKAHHIDIQGRQDDDEDESSFSELGKDIIKIVGSALSGNVSALIDSSSALIPESVASTVSGALSVLVESINNARPPPTTTTTTEPSTTEEPEETSVRDLSAEVSELPSTTLEATTLEDENEGDGDLRSNASTTVTVSSTAATVIATSAISLTQLNSQLSNESAPVKQTPEPKPEPEAATTTRAEVLTLPPVTETTTTPIPTTTYNPTFEGSDVDNKANWQDLVNNQNSPASGQNPNINGLPSDDIDSDNKANWISLLTNQENEERLKPTLITNSAPVAMTTTMANLSLSPLKDSNFNIYTVPTPHLLVTLPDLTKPTYAPIKIQNSHMPSPIGTGNRGNSKAPGNNILDAFATANRYPMFSSYPINDKNNNNKNNGPASPLTNPAHLQTASNSNNVNHIVNQDTPIKTVQIEMGGNLNSNSNSNSLSNKLTALLQSTKPKLSNYSSNVINLIKYQEWLASQLTTTEKSGGDWVSDSNGAQVETSTGSSSGSGSSNSAGNSGSESVKGVVTGNGSSLGSSSKNNVSLSGNYASGFDYSKFTTPSISTSTSTTESDTDIEESSVSSIVPGSSISSSTANTEDEDEDEDEENEESNSV